MNNIVLLVILLLPLVASLISFLIGRVNERNRDIFNIIATGAELILITLFYKKVSVQAVDLFVPDIMGTGLYLKLDMFRYMFVWITAFIWFLTTIYSTQYILKYKHRNRYYSFFLLTLGSTIGIFISENLLNLFTFFEIMSFTSYFLVIHDEDKYSHDAGKTYIEMAIAGGLILLMGLFLLYDYTGALNISEISIVMVSLGNIKYLISALIIIGFGVKASIVPLHVWLPKAHPAAPAPASAVLSGILIKTGIFGILITVSIMMNGDIILSSIMFVLGFINMLMGGFLALFQRNIKRILAYSSMSQAGYILLGIGLIGLLKEYKEIAIYGVMMHIFNHAIFKVLLFLGVGIIYMILHEASINVVRGFGRHKVILKIVFLIGALSVMGIPGFNGFISKTILHEALSEAHHIYNNIWFTIAEIAFTIGSSFTVAYLLKIFVAVFIDDNEKYRGQYKEHIKLRAVFPMVILSCIIIYIGIKPYTIMSIMVKTVEAFGIEGHFETDFFSLTNYKPVMISVLLGLLIYYTVIKGKLLRITNGKKEYINPSLNWISLENDVYIPVVRTIFVISSKIFHFVDNLIINIIECIISGIKMLNDIEFENGETKTIKNSNRLNYKKFFLYNKAHKIKKNKTTNVEDSNLGNIVGLIRRNMNSIIYSVFIFAMILTIFLIVLVL